MGGKNLTQMRADIRLDLKDSGSLWSNAEIDRCIEQSYADLSRFRPLEKSREYPLEFTVTAESVVIPEDTDPDQICDGVDISSTSAGDTLTITAQPDAPRPLTLTITDANASVTLLSLIVRGTDENDQSVTEKFQYTLGMSTVTGRQYFKTCYEVEVDQISGNAASDVLDLGVGAIEDVWVSLANKPIKWGQETVTDSGATTTYTRNTDYYIDAINGRIKLKASSSISAGDTILVSYTKSQLAVDISDLPGFIRVETVFYPVGDVPQSTVSFDVWDMILTVLSQGDYESQSRMSEDKNIQILYAAQHQPPTASMPGTAPEFLDNTILLASAGYALFIYSLKQEIAAETSMTAAAAKLLAVANGAGNPLTALTTALDNVKKYLDNNSDADAAGLLQDITDDVADLRDKVTVAAAAMATALGLATTDVGSAANFADYTDYVSSADVPSIKQYLKDGDDKLDTLNIGGEQTNVPLGYLQYAQGTQGIIGAYERYAQTLLSSATGRTNLSMVYAQEAAQRMSNLRSYLEQSAAYQGIAAAFARKAETHLGHANALLREAEAHITSSASNLQIADRFRTQAIERRNMAWAIWRDRNQLLGNIHAVSTRQPNLNIDR